jgi:hypothetical protein
MAELQALQMDPTTFVQEGIVWINAHDNWWEPARLSGDRDSLKLSTPLKWLSEAESGVFKRGLRIEHSQDSCPEFIVFRPFPRFRPAIGFKNLKSELTRLGYNVED